MTVHTVACHRLIASGDFPAVAGGVKVSLHPVADEVFPGSWNSTTLSLVDPTAGFFVPKGYRLLGAYATAAVQLQNDPITPTRRWFEPCLASAKLVAPALQAISSPVIQPIQGRMGASRPGVQWLLDGPLQFGENDLLQVEAEAFLKPSSGYGAGVSVAGAEVWAVLWFCDDVGEVGVLPKGDLFWLSIDDEWEYEDLKGSNARWRGTGQLSPSPFPAGDYAIVGLTYSTDKEWARPIAVRLQFVGAQSRPGALGNFLLANSSEVNATTDMDLKVARWNATFGRSNDAFYCGLGKLGTLGPTMVGLQFLFAEARAGRGTPADSDRVATKLSVALLKIA